MKRYLMIGAFLFVPFLIPAVKARAENARPDPAIGQVISSYPSTGMVGETITLICTNVNTHKIRVHFSGLPSIASVKTLSNTNIQVTTVVPRGVPQVSDIKLSWDPNQEIGGGQFTLKLKVSETEAETLSRFIPNGGNYTGSSRQGNGANPPFQVPPIDLDLDLPAQAPVYVPPWLRVSQPPIIAPIPPSVLIDPPPVEIPPVIYGKNIVTPSGSLVYVIDISGSMGWEMGQYTTPEGQTAIGCRLDRAKAELVKSINSLPKNIRFNLEAYDCLFQCCFNGEGGLPLLPASTENKAKAITWIGQLTPQGATGTGPAMYNVLYYAPENLLYVLLTDGAPNCGGGSGVDSDPATLDAHLALIRNGNQAGVNGRKTKARIDVFGIGSTGMFKQFCLRVASDNGGSYTDVR